MHRWSAGETIVVRYIARSDGSVAMALPAITVFDDDDVLAVYVPAGTVAKDNWVVPPEERAAAVAGAPPSRARKHVDRTWRTDSIRLYLPGRAFSVWCFFTEAGEFAAWYGNLEAPFVRTHLGIDTRDHALDVIAHPNGQWEWKDEKEFARRVELGIDSFEHQAAVRAAGEEFIARFEHHAPPFNQGWESWRPPADWQPRHLPADWNVDLGTHALLK